MLPILVGLAIILLAAIILIRRARQFIRTRGKSACSNCPYSGSCSGHCSDKSSSHS